MISQIFKKIFGTRNTRLLKEYAPIVKKINQLEKKYSQFKDADFPIETIRLKSEYQKNKSLDDLIPEAFAIVREASKRSLGLRHFDEQLLGGIALHFGKIAEMKTGEGKTLVSTLSAYLNTLSKNSVYIITVNDYLAHRDSEWMGKIYNFLGLSVGTITGNLESTEKKSMYTKDIVYGTNNEFGFDYLRDNMVYQENQKVQGKLSYAIIDEVDSVLIDEARTPLIISGSATESGNLYMKINKLTKILIAKNNDKFYNIDEKQKSVSLTEDGHKEIENILINNNLINEAESLYSPKNIQLLHLIDASLKANLMYHKDIDYVVENNEVIIIDEFSGRKMAGRRWSEGLHQSVEAKEKVKIQNENQTYASITFQNYFRLFDKLSGMTGTADTEATEFQQIYNLEVVVIPTHRNMIRKDQVDLVYLTTKEKYDAIVNEINDVANTRQPVLVGTTSIESSEYLSGLLKQKKIKHSVLNAKYHQQESEIISQAGKLGTVTIATNMAGRGTDIVLGGNHLFNVDNPTKSEIDKINKEAGIEGDEVKKLGGLYIIGTERHESRRVDNQLRGRAGRQGDPGMSKFYLSLEDNLMRIFASDKVTEIMKKLGMQDGEAIEHKWVSRSIENAQKRVESHNFDIRKTLLEYDDIANEQRKVIYNQRNDILSSTDLNDIYQNILQYSSENLVYKFFPEDLAVSQWNYNEFNNSMNEEFIIDIDSSKVLDEQHNDARETVITYIKKELDNKISANLSGIKDDEKNELLKNIFLSVIDEDWRNHLSSMDYLRQGIGLRGYAQKNPKNEYKRESFEMFEEMLAINNYEIIKILSRISVNNSLLSQTPDSSHKTNDSKEVGKKNISRNALCPCGSGKKYKRCCGRL